ncbi:hypothetical protein AB0M11_18725 [Streptomyces sp. NPDC051987]
MRREGVTRLAIAQMRMHNAASHGTKYLCGPVADGLHPDRNTVT